MTIDDDYENNWNKENISIGEGKKMMTFPPSITKREPLTDVNDSASNERITKRVWSPNNKAPVHAITSVDGRPDWVDLANNLRCDEEEDENELMRELLSLCSWYKDSESEPGSKVLSRLCSIDTSHLSCDSDEDEEETFFSFIRSKQASESTASGRVGNVLLENNKGTKISSMCLESGLSVMSPFDSSVFNTARNAPADQSEYCETDSAKTSSCINPFALKASCKRFKQLEFEQQPSLSPSKNLVDEHMEQAFRGVIKDDNDDGNLSNCCATNSVIPVVFTKSMCRTEGAVSASDQPLNNFWLDFDFKF